MRSLQETWLECQFSPFAWWMNTGLWNASKATLKIAAHLSQVDSSLDQSWHKTAGPTQTYTGFSYDDIDLPKLSIHYRNAYACSRNWCVERQLNEDAPETKPKQPTKSPGPFHGPDTGLYREIIT